MNCKVFPVDTGMGEMQHVEVRLSRRNLTELIGMLDANKAGNSLIRRVGDNTLLMVIAEVDDKHYDSRDPENAKRSLANYQQRVGIAKEGG